MARVDPDIEQLVREERLVDAAELAGQRGAHAEASILYERACVFELAAREAALASDWERVLVLANDDDATVARAVTEVAHDAQRAKRIAEGLAARGRYAFAGRVFETAGARVEAAEAYARGGAPIKAAELFESAGQINDAGRVLEAALGTAQDRDAIQIAKGALLLRFGKLEEAVRALQQVAAGRPARRSALTLLARALERLGLEAGRDAVERELHALGGPDHDIPEVEAPQSARARIFGRYALIREVASSPSARVLECVDDLRRERVALKIFAGTEWRGRGRDALLRFEREVEILGAIDHPNVVPLRGYLPEGPALALAWMGGGTLAERLSTEAFTPGQCVEIAGSVLLALAEAHRLGVVHRDVKPANVLFDEACTAKLSDFGVAHLGDGSTTRTAGVIGTLAYMSPEQREGRPATIRSDIYAVGIMLWEMLTGERPDSRPLGPKRAATHPSDVHEELTEKHDVFALSMIALAAEDRPEDALAAYATMRALSWPDTTTRVVGPKSTRPPQGASLPPRLTHEGDAVRDGWLDRQIAIWPLDPVTLERASAIARVDHAAMQTVLRVDRIANAIWLEAPRGERLAGPLAPAQAARLGDALEQLHAAGFIHGSVDREHIHIDDHGLACLVATERAAPGQTATSDARALAKLTETCGDEPTR